MKKSVFIASALAAVFACSLCACSPQTPPPHDPVLTSISVGGDFETRYYVGEEFDPEGMVVTAHFDDDSAATVKMEDCTLSVSGALTADDYRVVVRYKNKSVPIDIAVGSDPTDEYAIEDSFEKMSFTHGETTLKYRMRSPDSEQFPAPILVFLHGAGERGSDNEAQLVNAICKGFNSFKCEIYDSYVIAPQCPAAPNQWVDTPWTDNYSVDAVPESDELAAVCALVREVLETKNADPSRVYVMGLSMGGFGTWDLLSRHSDLFAAGAPFCGGGDPSYADILAEIPIFTFHGTADTTVPVQCTERMQTAIEAQKKGLFRCVYFEGDGHNVWNKAITYAGDAQNPPLLDWLFSQKKA